MTVHANLADGRAWLNGLYERASDSPYPGCDAEVMAIFDRDNRGRPPWPRCLHLMVTSIPPTQREAHMPGRRVGLSVFEFGVFTLAPVAGLALLRGLYVLWMRFGPRLRLALAEPRAGNPPVHGFRRLRGVAVRFFSVTAVTLVLLLAVGRFVSVSVGDTMGSGFSVHFEGGWSLHTTLGRFERDRVGVGLSWRFLWMSHLFRVQRAVGVPSREGSFLGVRWGREIRDTASTLGWSSNENLPPDERAYLLSTAAVNRKLRIPMVYIWLLLLGPPAIAAFRFICGPYRRARRRARGLCVACGYNLTGLPEPRCPECGLREFDESVESGRGGRQADASP